MSRPSDSSESTVTELGPIPEPRNPDTDCDEVFAEKAELFRFSTETNTWIERGQGVLKILKGKESGVYRIVMRQMGTYVVRAHHRIPTFGELAPLHGCTRQFKWLTFDWAEGEEERELFAVRFTHDETAAAFKAAFQQGQTANKALEQGA